MLTRLRVKGFKNLKDVDLRFGPFACIAGPNGVGKSNLFDAIMFLGDMASMPIIKAAGRARGTNGRATEFECLFYRDKDGSTDRIEFVAEMLVPTVLQDDFDREARPTATFLEYTIVLRLNLDAVGGRSKEPIYIEHESLKAKSSSEASRLLEFGPSKEFIRQFVFGPGKRTTPFIDTEGEGNDAVIVLYGDKGGKGGRAPRVPAYKSPQSVLSGVNSISHPTALAARREMQSWRLMQLEPSALRRPDEFGAESQISPIGEHLPNALARLGNDAEVANRLAELLPDVRDVEVDEDEKRQLRTVFVTMRDGQRYSAGSLSDGTLRFLALSVLASDPHATGLVCMEEPENGIHPLRIPEMLKLVRRLSDADTEKTNWPGRSAPRQVLINTHSPLIVAELPEDELLMAQALRFKGSSYMDFKPLEGTWRTRAGEPWGFISKGELVAYLQGSRVVRSGSKSSVPRVGDRVFPSSQGDLFTSKPNP